MLEHPHRPRPHPDRVGQERVGGGREVGARGVAEVAEPLLARGRSAPRAPRRRRRPPPPRTRRRAARTSRRAADQRQGDVVVVEPADDRALPRPLACAAAVEPEAPRAWRDGDVAEEGDADRLLTRGSSSRAPRRARTGSTRGGTARPRAAASRWRTPITTPSSLHAVATRSGGQLHGRRASGSARPRTPAAARRRPRAVVADRATSPWAGATRATVPPYAVTSPCIPRQTPSTGRVPARSTAVPTEKSAGDGRVPRPRRQHHVRVPQHVVRRAPRRAAPPAAGRR